MRCSAREISQLVIDVKKDKQTIDKSDAFASGRKQSYQSMTQFWYSNNGQLKIVFKELNDWLN